MCFHDPAMVSLPHESNPQDTVYFLTIFWSELLTGFIPVGHERGPILTSACETLIIFPTLLFSDALFS